MYRNKYRIFGFAGKIIMQTIPWALDPGTVQQQFHQRHGQGRLGQLFIWATFAVEGLYYLAEIDNGRFDFRHPNPVEPYRLEGVDINHVRWAAGTAITALDLCAAGLGRQYCGWTRHNELDLRGFDVNTASSNKRREQTSDRCMKLPDSARDWVDTVLGDSRYNNVLEARHPLTHSLLPRNIHFRVRNHNDRTVFRINNTEIKARQLVLDSRDLAFKYVNDFLKIIDTL